MSSGESRAIPFDVEISRVIEILAHQIYQSPLALLRENAQNAFDAILIRQASDDQFEPGIEIAISPHEIAVTDNGVGMTPTELEENYWRAGSSGKNNAEARAAGVVGTFGVGAMANFGIASALTVLTESMREPLRTESHVQAKDLSTSAACISLTPRPPEGRPGTTVTATLDPESAVAVDEARAYIAQFVEFVEVPVEVNGEVLSGRSIRDVLPSEAASWRETARAMDLQGLATADIEIIGLSSGEIRVVLENIMTQPMSGRSGRAVLVQGTSAVRTLRSGFGLATISVPSAYRFGGVVDLPALKPTAGREALDDASNALLAKLFAAIDEVVTQLAQGHEEMLENQAFLTWIQRHQRFDLCGPLAVRVEPGGEEKHLSDFASAIHTPRYYGGNDQDLIRAYAVEDNPLIVLSRRPPRRDCEIGYLVHLGATEVSDQPQVAETVDLRELSVAHGAVGFRISRILAEDYFVEVSVVYARMTHQLPLMLESDESSTTLYIDPGWNAIATLLELYQREFETFGPFVKDFVRGHIFPKVAHLVPTSTRDGAEAFLRRLRGRRELFEIDWKDREDLESIWERYQEGEISLTEAAKRSRNVPSRSVVVVRPDQAATLSSVVPALEDSSPSDDETDDGDGFAPLPPVDRREASTDALLLTGTEALNGYSCFLALTERAHQQNGEFFFQPHSTSVVWGGQKILFVFQHHSGRFGLYYDIQCPTLVAPTSGGGPFRTSTLILANRIFIPVPAEIAHNFIPGEGERIKLEVRSDVLYLENDDAITVEQTEDS
jgi:molecular chaperone HtpG